MRTALLVLIPVVWFWLGIEIAQSIIAHTDPTGTISAAIAIVVSQFALMLACAWLFALIWISNKL